MKIGLSLSFIFKDDFWFKKITLPALCNLIPIFGGVVVSGWSWKVALNVIQGLDEPLPDMDFAEDLKRGFFVTVIGLLYFLPLYLIMIILQWRSFVTFQSTEVIVHEVSTGSVILSGIIYLVFLALIIFIPPAIMNFLVKDDFKAAFKFDEIWSTFRRNPWDWILILPITSTISMLLAPLGLILCIIGIIFIVPIISAMSSHLMAQAYLRSQNLPLISDKTLE